MFFIPRFLVLLVSMRRCGIGVFGRGGVLEKCSSSFCSASTLLELLYSLLSTLVTQWIFPGLSIARLVGMSSRATNGRFRTVVCVCVCVSFETNSTL